jgi:hypothetical protein
VPRNQIFFLSEEKWTNGNAFHAAELLGLAGQIHVLENNAFESQHIWAQEEQYQLIMEYRNRLVEGCIDFFLVNNVDIKKTVFVFDGYGPFIRRPMGLIYDELVKLLGASGVLFLEHGHLPNKPKHLMLDALNSMKIVFVSFLARKPMRIFPSRTLLLSRRSIPRALFNNPLLQRMTVVSDFVHLKVFAECKISCKQHQLLLEDKDLIVLTPGIAQRADNKLLQKFFCNLLDISESLTCDARIFLKVKPGESEIIHDFIEVNKIEHLFLLEESLCMSELMKPNYNFIFPRNSNAGIELLSKGMRAISYTWGDLSDPLAQYYRELKVPNVEISQKLSMSFLETQFEHLDRLGIKTLLEERHDRNRRILREKFEEILHFV